MPLRTCSSQLCSWVLGAAPTLVAAGLPSVEQDHRRDALNAVFGRRVGIVVDVELHDGDPLGHLRADLLERRGDHPARAAPFRPEIDEDGLVGAENLLLEAVVGDGLGGHGNLLKGHDGI